MARVDRRGVLNRGFNRNQQLIPLDRGPRGQGTTLSRAYPGSTFARDSLCTHEEETEERPGCAMVFTRVLLGCA
jgi:hypothetical protein